MLPHYLAPMMAEQSPRLPALRQRFGYWLRDIVQPFPTEPKYEVGKPWICYFYLSDSREAALRGVSRMELVCAICGRRDKVRLRIPRFLKPINPEGAYHPLRVAFLDNHTHRMQRNRRDLWALPLLNVAGVKDIPNLVEDSLRDRLDRT
jgi:hypothetical protein